MVAPGSDAPDTLTVAVVAGLTDDAGPERQVDAGPERQVNAGPERQVDAGPERQVNDDELAARLRVAVTRLNRRLRQETLTGVSPSQEAALATISRLGSPTLGELAQAEQVQPPTMTRVVATMEAAALVIREGDAGDRRVIRVRLTPEGRAKLDRIRSLKNAYLAHQIGRLTAPERSRACELAALLEQLMEGR